MNSKTNQKQKRRKNDPAEWKLFRWLAEANSKNNDRIEVLQSIINVFCLKLDITKIPSIRFCDVYRQNECLGKNKKLKLCGGACYVGGEEPTIWIREQYISYDTLLHELFHFISDKNLYGPSVKIMYAWHHSAFGSKTNYLDLFKRAGIKIKPEKRR